MWIKTHNQWHMHQFEESMSILKIRRCLDFCCHVSSPESTRQNPQCQQLSLWTYGTPPTNNAGIWGISSQPYRCFPQIMVPQNGWLTHGSYGPMKMENLGVPLFLQTLILVYQRLPTWTKICWWQPEIRNPHQLRLVVYPVIYVGYKIHPRWSSRRISGLPSTVCLEFLGAFPPLSVQRGRVIFPEILKIWHYFGQEDECDWVMKAPTLEITKIPSDLVERSEIYKFKWYIYTCQTVKPLMSKQKISYRIIHLIGHDCEQFLYTLCILM